jgi:hypothetical protein
MVLSKWFGNWRVFTMSVPGSVAEPALRLFHPAVA